MTARWIVSVVKKDTGVVDSVWGGGFVVLGAAHARILRPVESTRAGDRPVDPLEQAA